MKSKGHLYTSIAKSVIRIGGSLTALIMAAQVGTRSALAVLTYSLLVAEILGVVEELLDKRD